MEENNLSSFPRNPGATLEQCQSMIHKSLLSPQVRFLMEQLEKAGCLVGDNFIKAVKCNETGIAGGYTKANLDWTKCAHHACSEIRAGHLSGDCHFKRELLRLTSLKIRGHEQECIRRRVMKSLSANPYCSGVAKAAVESVWDVCYNDTEPYDRTL
ncbi:mitochondrial inner membrane protease ATP23 isoform X3 [Vigna angularis]|uniref:mitochondrial inner membrane protease ATP23 isoform X3 n=1 Tax=Phaseolus angularis TaxID=3914 RepID=UPI0022B56480|nr:mitochondrial inner membrane protease ATP23 isoform X3 [Vigna angularis]